MPEFEALYKELERAKVPLQKFDAADQLLAEADYALRPHSHEGKIVTYGFIRVEHLAKLEKYVIVSPDDLTITQARSIADGKNLFVVIEDKRYAGLTVLDKSLSSERDIVAFQKELGGIIGITDNHGITKFISSHGISLHELRDWKLKPNVSQVARVISQHAPMVNRGKLVAILEFCLHTLGANKIGATLVWFLDKLNQDVLTSVARVQTDTQSLEINLVERQNLSALQSILERNDGAALISSDGKLIGVGAHLVTSPKSIDLIQAYTGTRHTSARRFSYDRSETIVFTVSSDGPVTIFSDGLKIGEINTYDAFTVELAYRSVAPDPNDVESNSWETTCPNCGKTSVIHEIFIYGWRERETVDCLLCGTQIEARKCYQLNAQLVKRFS
jgi:DNA integrity scanning protein DisA with diadenylate cyclase activity